MTRPVLYSLVGLLASLASAQSSNSSDVITDASYFDGLSPPYYPSPNGTGTGSWAEAYSKAKAFVDQLTLEEKVSLTGGAVAPNGCSGYIDPIPRLNFSGLCLSDAGNGLRSVDFVSSWASGWSVGASWNRDLAHQRAVGMASEFVKKGANVALGPVVGPLGRTAQGGRNWEGFSNDPYLSGQLASETVSGMQSTGIITSLKHYIANEQETNRVPGEGIPSSVSANLDDKTIHELYLWPFADAIKAGTGNVMCSYNRINGSWACQNSWTLNNLLKTELGFQGFVVSDWAGQHSGVASANAGLDMAMPYGAEYWADNLTEAVRNGSVDASRVDDQATRILAAWYKMGQDSADYPATARTPGFGIPSPDLSAPHEKVVGWNASYKNVLYQGAVEGHVLVKNANNALPLKSPQLLSLFGYSVKAPDAFNYGVYGWQFGQYPLAPIDGNFYDANPVYSGIASNGTIITGGGSGANQPAYYSSPFEAFTARAQEDYTALYWDFHSTNPSVNPNTDACIVIGNAYASETWDRPNLHEDYTDSIILNVAANCSNTIVVFQNAGARLVDTFVDHPNVTAVVFAHLPGQDSGKALVNLLYGDENFSGKLPYSVPKNESDYDGLDAPDLPEGAYQVFPQSDFTEGIYIDYRALDAKNITPRYEFGFGLSYTSFAYSDLAVVAATTANNSGAYPTGEIREGGREDLWDVLATVTATVANTGAIDGAEVAQLYVGVPNGPVRQLRGFAKPALAAGASDTVTFELTRRDLSTWDVAAQEWLLQRGDYAIYVGPSSRSLPLTGTLAIE